jgi:CBS domain-containing protein
MPSADHHSSSVPIGTTFARGRSMTTTTERRLPIHLRQIVGRNGLRTFEEVVSCPRKDRAMSIDECVDCEHCRQITFANDQGSSLACVVPTESPVPIASNDPQIAQVATIMTRAVHCVRPDTRLESAAALFLERGIRAAPVVDGDGKVLGVVTRADLAGAGATVGLVMSHHAFSLPERATVARAAELLMHEGTHCVPVVAADRTILGIVTPRDITRWIAREGVSRA